MRLFVAVQLSEELKKRNIPVSIETEIEASCDEVQLIISLLRLYHFHLKLIYYLLYNHDIKI